MDVYSKMYRVPYEQIGSCQKDFIEEVKNAQLSKKGNLFYTLRILNNKADVEVELFLPSEKPKVEMKSTLRYRNYYIVNNMVSVMVKNNFEINVGNAYIQLMDYAKQNAKQIISPFYHEIIKIEQKIYFIVKVVMKNIN